MNERRELYSIYALLLTVTVVNFFGGFLGFKLAAKTRINPAPAVQSQSQPASDNISAAVNYQIRVDTVQTELSSSQFLENFTEPYDVTPRPQASGTTRIPVILYHHINKIPDNSGERLLNVTPETFLAQMNYLSSKGYRTLSMSEFLAILATNQNPVQKSVVITFDDGYQDTITNALPVLQKFGFKATWFIPLNKSEISKADIKALSDAGMDIGSHTMDHASLKYLTTDKQRQYEVGQSVTNIQNITGKPVLAFAYPYCVYNNDGVDFIKRSTIQIAFQCGNVTGNSIDHNYGNRYLLHRSWMYNNLQNFIDRLSGVEYRPVDQPPAPDQKGFHFKVL
jgi:peptidoglycan/xylan/chitin deacetylase (PgdA/CDA1 family)